MNQVPEKKYPPVGKGRDTFDKGRVPGRYQSMIEQTAFQRDKALKREKFYWVLIVALVIAMVYTALTANYRVYAVRVDNTSGRIEEAQELKANSYEPRDVEIKYFLRQFITDTRTIGRDPVVLRQNWDRAQFFVTPDAYRKLIGLVEKENFFQRIGNMTQQPDIKMIQEQPGMPGTYQIRWSEDQFYMNGARASAKSNYVGLFTVRIQPPKKENELIVNPLGIRIIDLTFASEDMK